MRRPLGVTLIAILLVVSSVLTLTRALAHPGLRLGHRLFVASVIVAILALVAAEALWSLRPRAFLTFTVWALGAMAILVLSRLPLTSPGQGVRLMGPIACAGLAYAVAALYLRRAV